MVSKIAIAHVLFQVFLCQKFQPLEAQTWVQAGYWYSGSGFPISDINSALYTHLICAFAEVNSSSYELSVSPDDEQSFSSFTATVKQKNPSITTLLSIGGGNGNYTVLSSMVRSSSSRKSFIQSSIKIAMLYGFQGLDLSWATVETSSDTSNMGRLFEEWRAAAKSEAENNSSTTELILTASVQFRPVLAFSSYPVESIQSNLNWVTVMAFDYYMPQRTNFTAAFAALYDPSSYVNTDSGIKEWIGSGVAANKLILGFAFYGYAWKLRNSKENSIGASATGPAITEGGDMSYKDIKAYIQRYGAIVLYNATYVVNYFSVGSTWIDFDDVEVIKIKVSYAKEKKLLGYAVWQVPYDDNWVLSSAAAEQVDQNRHHSRRLLVIILITTSLSILLFGILIYYLRRRFFKPTVNASRNSRSNVNKDASELFHGNAPDLQVFSYSDIVLATDGFSIEKKLGQGGYGPVYKGILPDGQEIAVKKLSKASTQGFEEFKTEVMLTARLQHVNHVRLLGYYIDGEEQMLIYEYMPNKSLDFYLFDPMRKFLLDWGKRIDIIEGIIQGLLYLQEYSRLTIIHRDIKASNILLDSEMKPKISDFGMARIFRKDKHEANTSKIVGTYGYVSPEYVMKGLYSTKSDVYNFGVLLLQIVSGRKVACLYGEHENLNLMEYAYELWKEGKGMDFTDPSLDDMSSTCKLLKCMQIALLCVQEDANDRPSVKEISSMLKNDNIQTIPKRPAFSTNKAPNEFIMHREKCSVNDASISEAVAR
ncbi:G-type lectin S-receptor-like serine/threonine-protein kinase At4g03230 [Abrus precatorius]|uniref:G-type lectin S-receptor-like serine/threonine-protein kinase At4g03230 n=1 Tax=Abrus precatorius TaxID=3816 RepID=A0A8B8K3Q7_ABRPR|nr:G-type lectin S-receptor-like serine/threonine-protein kinase At4g03230 [Abrus precatorius]